MPAVQRGGGAGNKFRVRLRQLATSLTVADDPRPARRRGHELRGQQRASALAMSLLTLQGAKNLYVRSTSPAPTLTRQIISVTRFGARLNRLPAAAAGDMVLATVKKGKPDLRKKVHQAIVIRQRKPWRRKDGIFLCAGARPRPALTAQLLRGQRRRHRQPEGRDEGLGDRGFVGARANAADPPAGPVAKECADLWPRIASNAGTVV